ncbi:DNA internalization-related competence protein ComEC/Rec2 [Candidatus Sumerlaeota bacterium]
MRHPLFIVSLVYIAGLVIGRLLFIPPLLIGLALALIVGSSCWLLRQYGREKAPRPSGALLFIAVLLIGLFQQNQVSRTDQAGRLVVEQLAEYHTLTVRGTLAADPDVRARSARLTLRDARALPAGGAGVNEDWRSIPGRIQVVYLGRPRGTVAARWPAVGDTVTVRGPITRPPALSNPDVFNYQAYLEARGIYGSVVVRSSRELDFAWPTGGRSAWGRLRAGLYRFRVNTEAAFVRRLGERPGALLASICFGRGHRLDAEVREDFAQCGLLHIFAVSGLHAGMIGIIVFLLAITLRLPRPVAALATILCLLGYMVLVGMRPPVVRAVIMGVALLAAAYLAPALIRARRVGLASDGVSADSLSAYSLALFAVLLVSPRLLVQASFQLSYLAILGIIVFYPLIAERLRAIAHTSAIERRWLRDFIEQYVLGVLAVTLAAQVLLIPLLANYFHRVPLLGMLANIVVIPLVFLAIVAGILLVAAAQLAPMLAPLFGAAAGFLCELIMWLARGAAAVPLASLEQPAWPWFVIALYYAMVVAPASIRRTSTPLDQPKRAAALTLQAVAILLFLVAVPLLNVSRGQLRVAFLDAGQGDCAVLEFPSGETIVIDAGTRFAGRSALIPYLEARGIEYVELALITHDDLDHYGGFLELLERAAVGRLLLPADPTVSGGLRQLRREAKRRGTRCEVVMAPLAVAGLPGARFELLYPEQAECVRQDFTDNDLSLVARLSYGQVSFLFAGDLTRRAEKFLLEDHPSLSTSLLKVAHHGSDTGSGADFLAAVAPSVALISCGEDNPFGHPAPAVLERLRAAGAKVYRTDRDGAVIVESDGTRTLIKTTGR